MNKKSGNNMFQYPFLLHWVKFCTLGLMGDRIAHKINNSIQGVLLVLNCLETDYPLDENIAILDKEVQEIKNLVRSMLDYSKTDTLELEPIDLTAVIHDTLALLKDLTGDPVFTNIKAHHSLSGPLMTRGNYFSLQQAFLNILLYCSRSMNGRSLSHIEIAVLTDYSPQMHTIRVRCPDGHAMEQDQDSGSIDELFYTLIHQIFDLHKGTFRIIYEDAGNSDFIVTLPIQHMGSD